MSKPIRLRRSARELAARRRTAGNVKHLVTAHSAAELVELRIDKVTSEAVPRRGRFNTKGRNE